MKKQFKVSIDYLYPMLEFICSQATNAGFDKEYLYRIELASEEAIVNVLKYSGLDPSNIIDITCTPTGAPGIQITIRDRGVPYNPLSVPEKNLEVPLEIEDAPLGGYGVHLMKKLMDHVHYERDQDANVLTLTKYISCK